MQVVKLSQKHNELILNFCTNCDLAGYKNNNSFESMKWGYQYDLPDHARFWALIVNNEIASIGGVHKLENRKLRCLFRGATLPKYSNIIPGISRYHMNSIPFSILMPYQLSWGIKNNYNEFYITTSHGSHDASGKMSRMHKAISLLTKNNIVTFSSEEIIYNIPQTIWRLNLKEYVQALKIFEQTRQRLKIEENYTTAITTITDFLKCH